MNDLTKKDAHPLPRIDDTLDTLGGAQWFSTLDLASGYWQVEVDPADREKTAFATLMLSINFVLCLLGYVMHREHSNVSWNMSCEAYTGLPVWST